MLVLLFMPLLFMAVAVAIAVAVAVAVAVAHVVSGLAMILARHSGVAVVLGAAVA